MNYAEKILQKGMFAQEQEYRMVFLCVHKREHQVPENSIPVEYRIKDEVFIPFIRMKLGDISCLKSVCVGTKNRVIWRLRDCGIILEAEIWKCV